MKIGKYIELSDLTSSSTATRLNIDNKASQEIIDALTDTIENVYDPLCDHLGIVHINSAYRSVALNKAIGGSSTSQHCKGEALDLSFNGIKSTNTNSTIFNYIRYNLKFDQMIWEFGDKENPQWVHVSFSKTKNRQQILRSVKKGGRTIYQTYKDAKKNDQTI